VNVTELGERPGPSEGVRRTSCRETEPCAVEAEASESVGDGGSVPCAVGAEAPDPMQNVTLIKEPELRGCPGCRDDGVEEGPL
jgi:hypothetical protein